MNKTRSKIVLLDDSIAVLNQGKHLLQDFYRVYTVQSPVTFFENLEHDIPDLILLDVIMPEMSGFEVIKKLKADLRYKDIPVIFLTSKSDAESEREGFSLGAVDYITKPFSEPLLQKRISNQILYERVQSALTDHLIYSESLVRNLENANKFTSLMLDSIPICCQLFNSSFKKIDCNIITVQFFGFKNKQDYLERYLELYPEFQPDGQRSVEKVLDFLTKVRDNGYYASSWMYRMLDGTLLQTENVFVRIEHDDDFVILGYTRDLKEYNLLLKTVEQMRESAQLESRAKINFLTNINHKMRASLSAMLGLIESTLGAEQLDAGARSNLTKAYDTGETLSNLNDDFLDILKIEAGRLELNPREYDLRRLLDDTIAKNTLYIGEKPVSFVRNIEEDLPNHLYGDELRIKQILSHLLSNAFKFTEKGTVELGVRCKRDGNTVWLTAWVRDTGIGIQPDELDNIFTIHGKPEEDNRQTEGAGLGLSLSKKIAEMMDGSITAESEHGKGSVFTVKLRQKYVNMKYRSIERK